MPRVDSSIKNLKYSIIFNTANILIAFLARTIFIRILGIEFLGLNNLLANLVSLLSLSELGIGTAINFSLYKPLGERDHDKVRELMKLYQKSYRFIGIIILVLGIFVTPYITYFVKEIPDISNISIIFLLFVINTSISYAYSYKRALIVTDQKSHVITLYHFIANLILNSLQILVLLITKNYILYLVLQLFKTAIENYVISLKADKLYPFLKGQKELKAELPTQDKQEIIKNTKALIIHRLGSYAVKGTDNILISKFVGLAMVGIYSNYQLVLQGFDTFSGFFYQAITASVGNLGSNESIERRRFIFSCVDLLTFWLYSFASISIIILINPFIELWLGNDYELSMPIVILIVINFYLKGMRKSVLTFKDALGLYWFDRFKPIFEAIVNLTSSVILAIQFGTIGIILGTTLSTLTTVFWIEPYILFKYGLNQKSTKYFVNYLLRTVIFSFTTAIVICLTRYNFDNVIIDLAFRIGVVIVVPFGIYIIAYRNTNEFKYLMTIFKMKMLKK